MAKRKHKEQPIPKPYAVQLAPWIARLDSERCAVVVLVAVWLAAVILVDPRGNFPLNDDWCYGKAVFHLIRSHEIRFVGITTMTLIVQVLWGALFCLIFGMSFTSLRLSTLALGLAGVLAVYGLLKEIGAPRWIAVIGALVLALNPLYVSLSSTFMTDVPFAALAFLSVYAYVRALKRESAGMIVLGTAFACLAALIRQFGIILPIGFGLAYLVKNGVRVRTLVASVVPTIVTGILLTGFVQCLKAAHRLPSYYNNQAEYLKKFLDRGFVACLAGALKVVVTLYLYLGLFLLPFLILTFPRTWGKLTARQRSINTWVSALSMPVVFCAVIRSGVWMPTNFTCGDLIVDLGLGAPTMGDIFRLVLPNYPTGPEWFWIAVTVASTIGGGLLLWHLMAAVELLAGRQGRVSVTDKGNMVLLLSVTVMYLAPIVPLTAFTYFDRYFLCAVPLLIALSIILTDSLSRPNRRLIAVSVIIIMLYGYFSVAGTHDYLSWNRLRWHIAGSMMRKYGCTPQDMDGGYEFNGWHNYRENDPKQQWWRMERDYFMITFGPVRNYDVVERFAYRRWLPPSEGQLFLLKRSDVVL